MSSYRTFADRWSVLAKLLQEKPFTPVADTAWAKAAKDLDKIISYLNPYYIEPKLPRPADVKAVKGHEITAEIKAFLGKDKDAKAFFTLGYFEEKCVALPDKDLARSLRKGATKDALLTTFLVYHYWKARPDPQLGLERSFKELKSDYDRSPAVREAERARAAYRSLLGELDLGRVVQELQSKFPTKEELVAFAKVVGIKVPAGKKPIHERVAAKILKAGEVVRTNFRGSTGKTS